MMRFWDELNEAQVHAYYTHSQNKSKRQHGTAFLERTAKFYLLGTVCSICLAGDPTFVEAARQTHVQDH